MSKVKLHRCSHTYLKVPFEPCHKVQKALDEQGIPYEVVQHGYGKGRRPAIEALSGQGKLPVLELPDGTAYRAESKDMAARVRAGDLPTA